LILATDVQYEDDSALVAGVLFKKWDSKEAHRCIVKPVMSVEPYEPGSFYKRELPCLTSLLDEVDEELEVIVVDGFVSLGMEQSKGLGMHLFETLGQKISVVGVAKKAFKDTPKVCEVFRGGSLKPLYVTSVGVPLEKAKTDIALMHGKYRIPALLKKADQLCRGIGS